MTTAEIEAKVKAIIVDKLGVDENEVKSEASFANDLGADSLDTVELIMEFEKVFSISIPDDQAEKISTVGDAIAYITNAIASIILRPTFRLNEFETSCSNRYRCCYTSWQQCS